MPSYDGVNYPGPWQMRFFYDCIADGYTWHHVSTINMDVDTPPDPGSDFADYDLMSRQGLYYSAETYADAVAAAMADMLQNNAVINYAELWKYEGASNDASFQSSYTLGVAGTSASSTVTDSQAIWSMRSQNGGVAFFEMFHVISIQSARKSYAASGAAVTGVWDLLTDLSSPALARDGGYLFTPLWFMPGHSEHYFRKRLR